MGVRHQVNISLINREITLHMTKFNNWRYVMSMTKVVLPLERRQQFCH